MLVKPDYWPKTKVEDLSCLTENICESLRTKLLPKTKVHKRKSNETIKRLHDRPDEFSFIGNKRIKWFRHAWRANGQFIKNIQVNKIIKTKSLGWPKTWYIDLVTKYLSIIDQNASLEWQSERNLKKQTKKGDLVAVYFLTIYLQPS